jgi:hypothetical protein
MVKISVFPFAKSIKDILDQFVTEHRGEEEHGEEEWMLMFLTALGITDDSTDESSTDPIENSRATSADSIDHTVIHFGKFKGRTPDQIAGVDESYIRWAYETLDRKFCSYVLYRECGGRISPRWGEALATSPTKPIAEKPTGHYFDEYDDDIPF